MNASVLGAVLGALLALSGAVVLVLLPKVSSLAQRALLRGVALAQLVVGGAAAVYFAWPR